MRKWGF